MSTDLQNLKKFHLLEEKIDQAVRRLGELAEKYEALRKDNRALNERITELTSHNRELSKQIEELQDKESKAAETAIDKEEIRRRIDRVLEKFGELQL